MHLRIACPNLFLAFAKSGSLRRYCTVAVLTFVAMACFADGRQDTNWPLGPPEVPPAPKIIDLPEQNLLTLLTAPRVSLQSQSTMDLIYEYPGGDIENTRIENFGNSYQGWIHYARQRLSATRVYRPRVMCMSDEAGATWTDCHTTSWIDLQTESMSRPIRFDGNLTDDEIDRLLQFIDQGTYFSSSDGLPVNSAKVYQIIKCSKAGARVNVYVRTGPDGPTDVLYFDHKTNVAGLTEFEVSQFRGSRP